MRAPGLLTPFVAASFLVATIVAAGPAPSANASTSVPASQLRTPSEGGGFLLAEAESDTSSTFSRMGELYRPARGDNLSMIQQPDQIYQRMGELYRPARGEALNLAPQATPADKAEANKPDPAKIVLGVLGGLLLAGLLIGLLVSSATSTTP